MDTAGIPASSTGGESPVYLLPLRAQVPVWKQSCGGITLVDSSPSPSIYGEIKKRLLSRGNFSTSLASVSLSLRLRRHLLDSQMTRENTTPKCQGCHLHRKFPPRDCVPREFRSLPVIQRSPNVVKFLMYSLHSKLLSILAFIGTLFLQFM